MTLIFKIDNIQLECKRCRIFVEYSFVLYVFYWYKNTITKQDFFAIITHVCKCLNIWKEKSQWQSFMSDILLKNQNSFQISKQKGEFQKELSRTVLTLRKCGTALFSLAIFISIWAIVCDVFCFTMSLRKSH